MGGVDPSSSDMTLTNLLFSTFIQAVEADHKWTCQVHSQMTSAKREPGRYSNLYLNTLEILSFPPVQMLQFACFKRLSITQRGKLAGEWSI